MGTEVSLEGDRIEAFMHDVIMHIVEAAQYELESKTGSKGMVRGYLHAALIAFTDAREQFGFVDDESEDASRNYIYQLAKQINDRYTLEVLARLNNNRM